MKNKSARIVTLLLVAGFMAGSGLAFAGKGMACCESGHKMDKKMSKHMDKMSKKLKLTDAQRAEMEKANQETGDKMEKIQNENEEKIMSILDDAQKAKYKEWTDKNHGK